MGIDSGVALSKSTTWVTLEAMVRDAVQTLLQRALEAELTEHLGRTWYERRAVVDAPVGYRNGHGKPRRLALSCGTVTLRRPPACGIWSSDSCRGCSRCSCGARWRWGRCSPRCTSLVW